MSLNNNYPNVSIIVIGKNEEKNLPKVLNSCQQINYPRDHFEIIYVDNNSTDNSFRIAKRYTNKVFSVTSDWPTPGLPRNKGLKEAKYDIVHFLDGDIEMNKDYLKHAVRLMEEKKCEAVFGYLKERRLGINKVLLSHWHEKEEGFVETSGGGGTYKKKPLITINGYDERIRKGQETEMGERFIQNGYQIWFAKIPMGIHDYGITSVSSLFEIPYIMGKSVFYNFLIRDNNTNFIKKQKNNNIKYFLLNSFFYSSLILYFTYSKIPLLFFLILFMFRMIRMIVNNHPYKNFNSFLYTIMRSLYMFIVFFGQLSVLIKIFILKKISKPKSKAILN